MKQRVFWPCRYRISFTRLGLLVFAILLLAGIFLIFWSSAGKNVLGFHYHNRFLSSLFFIETAGSSMLNPRQACAVESAARHHPSIKIVVAMFNSQPFDQFDLLRHYRNIRIESTNPENIFTDTPIWNWYRKKKWNNSFLKVYDLSDASRISLVWKYGGIYLDLDTVTLRPLYGLQNFLIKERTKVVSSSIFGFERKHSFLTKYFKMLPKEHVKGTWGSLGPPLFTKAYASLCNESSISVGHYSRCDLTLLPTEIAYPISWKNWKDYFDITKTNEVLMKINNSSLIHVWNKFSSKHFLSVNSGSVYEKAMKENCPIIYDKIVKTALLNSSFHF